MPVEDDNPTVRIIERVRYVKKNKVAAIVDHEVKRSSRFDDGGGVMPAAVLNNADIRAPHIRPQPGLWNDIL